MACYHPLQAKYVVLPNGKKSIYFPSYLKDLYEAGEDLHSYDFVQPEDSLISGVDVESGYLTLPCGKCSGCRVDRSRQWAVRMMHEAQMYDDNCFVTLTFSPEALVEQCELTEGGYSLSVKHMQDFMKRLRRRFEDRKIRVFYAGEYGEPVEVNGFIARPHYHLCLFNFDFPDKVFWRSIKKFRYYNSAILQELWPYGHSSISSLTFDSAAYVARYCTKKILGDKADDHYKGRVPEFGISSRRPGIGAPWLDKFGQTDVFAHDRVFSQDFWCKPPRFYDKYLEKLDPARYEIMKIIRAARPRQEGEDSNDRLVVKEACHNARMKRLVREIISV